MNEIYRVTSQERGFYRIDDGEGEYFAEVSGRLRHEAASRLDYPVVGDLVQADLRDDRAIIERVLPRHSLLVRRMAGGEGEQVIAANLDTLFVCMALNRDFNLRRLERYLAIAWESGAMPVVLLTKADLCDRVEERIAQVRATAPGVQVLCLGPFAQDAPELLAPWLGEGAGGQPLSHPPAAAPLSGEPSDTNSIGSLEACPGEGGCSRQRRYEFSGEFRKTADFGRFSLWRPTVVDRTRGSNRVRVLPGGNSNLWFPNSCREPAAASGSGHCPPGCAVRAAMEAGELTPERYRAYLKLRAEIRRAQDAQAALAAKNEKFKQIARINRKKGAK